jgi:hypothetical protein
MENVYRLIKVEAKLTEVSGQQMIDFFEGLDVQIDGNFSGMVSFSNYDGAWDFGTGFLQLNPSANANIKFNQGELIYGGVDPTDPQSKNLQANFLGIRGFGGRWDGYKF